jgi:hypothetical protein
VTLAGRRSHVAGKYLALWLREREIVPRNDIPTLAASRQQLARII